MHQQVDSDGDPLHGSQTNKLGVAEKSRGAVVVGVQEGQGLLLEEQEDRVNQFEVFGQVVELEKFSLVSSFHSPALALFFSFREVQETYVVDNNEGLSPSTAVVADCVKDTMSPDGRQQLLNEQSQ